MTARRVMWRWSWRLLRRERLQQLLILALIAFATGGAAFFATMIYYTNQPASAFTGSATERLTVTEGETSLEVTLRAVEDALGTIETTGLRMVKRDQSSVTFQLSDPPENSVFGAEPIRLLEGRRPSVVGEIAISPELADLLNITIGAEVPIEGTSFVVVGLVEDPANIKQPLAILPPGTLDDPDQYSVLAASSHQAGFDLQLAVPGVRSDALNLGDDAQLVAVTAAVAVAAVAMIEVALMCSAGFAILGQRRLRQLGILSSVGATSQQLRGALRANGLFVGLTGGTVGVIIGFAASLAARPTLEGAIGWRIPTWAVPWPAVIPLIALAGAAGLTAAWWPAHSLSQLPVVDALASRRRPASSNSSRWAVAGVIGFVVGASVLSIGVAQGAGAFAVVGLVVALIGLLLITPGLITIAAHLAPRLPLAPRLALRTISRNPARSGATLAVLIVAIGIPAAVVLTSSAADANLDAGPPNLPDNWVAIWPDGTRYGDVPTTFTPADHTEDIDTLIASLPDAIATPILLVEMPPSPNFQRVGSPMVNILRVAQIIEITEDGESTFRESAVWVATPELLEAIGTQVTPPTNVPLFSTVKGEVLIRSDGQLGPYTDPFEPALLDTTAYRDIGQYWMRPSQVTAQGGEPFVAGWLVTKPTAFTDQQLDSVYRQVDPALVVDAQRPDQTSDEIRRNTLIIGMTTALAILAIAVTLIRVESGHEDRTLAALGASRRTLKLIAATTTGFFALGAAALALPAGYLALIAITSDPGANYPIVFPTWSIVCLVVGVPSIGACAAYLLTTAHGER